MRLIETLGSWTRRHGLSMFALAVAAAGAQTASCGARTALDFPESNHYLGPATPAGSGGQPPAGTPAPPCESFTVEISDLRPAVTLLVDQSGSMASRYPDRNSPETRWSLVRKALFDSNNGVVKQFEHRVRFGIVFFTSHNGFSGGVCPMLSEVRAATDNYEALSSLYDQLEPEDDTPTGAALQSVVAELRAQAARGPQSIVLVTDGDADTCEMPDPQQGQPQAVAAAQAAFAAGIEVSVLGISSDIAGPNLQQLANAGKGKAIDAVWGVDPNAAQPFTASDDVRGLTAQLADILGGIPLCSVPLQRDVATDEASTGQVLLDGQPLAYGADNGFISKDPRHLEIVGPACDTLKTTGKELRVRISCN